MADSLRVVTYTRVSSTQQAQRGNTRTQQVELDRIIQREGWTLVGTYSDEGVSGKTIFDRPAFSQVLRLAESRSFDVLLVWDSDRIGRPEKRLEAAQLQDFLEEYGIRIYSPSTGMVDLSNEDQSFFAGLRSQVATLERRKILKRTQAGKLQKLKEGGRPSSVDPYGYRWEADSPGSRKGSYVIVPNEAKAVKEAVRLTLDGVGLGRIVVHLQANGMPPREAPIWAKTTLSKILRGTTIAGEYKIHQSGEDISYPVPPIVDLETWRRVQLIRSTRSERVSKSGRCEHLCSGVLTCGICGDRIWVARPRAGGRPYYRCSSVKSWKVRHLEGPCGNPSQSADEVDRVVWQQICRTLGDSDVLARACAVAPVEGDDPAEGLRARSKILDELASEVLLRRRRGLIPSSVCDSELLEISREKEDVARKLDRIERDQSAQLSGQRIRQELVERAKMLLSEGNQDLDARRTLLRLLVPRGSSYRLLLFPDGVVEIHGVLSLPSGVFCGMMSSGRVAKHTTFRRVPKARPKGTR